MMYSNITMLQCISALGSILSMLSWMDSRVCNCLDWTSSCRNLAANHQLLETMIRDNDIFLYSKVCNETLIREKAFPLVDQMIKHGGRKTVFSYIGNDPSKNISHSLNLPASLRLDTMKKIHAALRFHNCNWDDIATPTAFLRRAPTILLVESRTSSYQSYIRWPGQLAEVFWCGKLT